MWLVMESYSWLNLFLWEYYISTCTYQKVQNSWHHYACKGGRRPYWLSVTYDLFTVVSLSIERATLREARWYVSLG